MSFISSEWFNEHNNFDVIATVLVHLGGGKADGVINYLSRWPWTLTAKGCKLSTIKHVCVFACVDVGLHVYVTKEWTMLVSIWACQKLRHRNTLIDHVGLSGQLQFSCAKPLTKYAMS